jgi:hypothetical protein
LSASAFSAANFSAFSFSSAFLASSSYCLLSSSKRSASY